MSVWYVDYCTDVVYTLLHRFPQVGQDSGDLHYLSDREDCTILGGKGHTINYRRKGGGIRKLNCLFGRGDHKTPTLRRGGGSGIPKNRSHSKRAPPH